MHRDESRLDGTLKANGGQEGGDFITFSVECSHLEIRFSWHLITHHLMPFGIPIDKANIYLD